MVGADSIWFAPSTTDAPPPHLRVRRCFMMAEFAVVPLTQNHLTGAVAEALEEVKKCQVHYQLGPMGTTLEGSPDQVFLALRKCYEKLAHSQSRILMTITLDSRKSDSTTLSEMVRSVESCF